MIINSCNNQSLASLPVVARGCSLDLCKIIQTKDSCFIAAAMPLNNTDLSSSVSFCHECNRECQPIRLPEPHCNHCHSTFVEDINTLDSLSDLEQSDSPPIPSTRHTYDQQYRSRENQPSNSPHLLDPLLNIFGIQPISHHQDQDSNSSANPINFQSRPNNDPLRNPPTNSSQSFPTHSRSGLAEFLSRSSSQASTSPNLRRSSSSQTHFTEFRSNSSSNSDSPRFEGGIYTFTFDSRAPAPVFGFSTNPSQTRPASNFNPTSNNQSTPAPDHQHGQTHQQPTLQAFFSLVQSALRLMTSNNTGTANNNSQAQQAPSEAADDRQNDQSSDQTRPDSDRPNHTPMDDNTPPFRTGPTPTTPGVNLEDSHPLRQFINLLNTLNEGAGTPREGVNGFIIDGGTRFGFTTNFDATNFTPGFFAHNLGDYVTSDTAMQEILNQLANMAGLNHGHRPVPASESTIQSLKRFKFDSSRSGDEPVECAICKDSFSMDDDCMELPCRHFFHAEDCITPWLKQNGTCPVCRYSLVKPNESQGGSQGPNTQDESRQSSSSGPTTESASATEGESQFTSNSFGSSLHSTFAGSSNQMYQRHEEDYDYIDPSYDLD
ncbi:hypothetical protein O181_022526 [Austropuccinia psidii MF-1]|uniref:RING-type domain-containing protein n=1 Tax=Austropuccinia psidii MF-1 TaxID=1389203 RepID=A0A9Q3CHM3_9BASI|nr:hypothetical protein [Austropuccinia psidii MF-1]